MTIIVVDDNEQNRYQLQFLLGGNGYQVVTAVNGAEALAKARQNPPDLIVSDILMPVMDGFALCREWKKDDRLRSIPFIFYTATYTDERDRAFALSLGAERFLVKPECPEVLMQAVRDVLSQVQRSPAEPPAASPDGETGFLKQYNETLIRKLETKMQQLEQANRKLIQSLAERKQTEAALAEEAIRRRILVEESSDGIVVLDHEGKVFEANRRYAEMLGYTPEEVLQLHVWDWDSLSTREQLLEMIRQVDSAGAHFETRHRRKDGTFLDVEISTNGALCGGRKLVFCVCRDITARKRSEEALQESERRLAEAHDMAQLGYWMWDVKTGHVEWSDQVYTIFRLDPATFTPCIDSILAFSPWPEDCERDKELIRKAGESHEKGSYEQKILRQDKSVGFYQSTFQGRYDDQGELVSIVGTILDITERKRTEHELLKMQKLQSVGTLAGGIAHDFNNILTGVYGNISLAMEDLSKEHPSYALLEEAEKSMNRAVLLTKQLLTFAKGGTPVKENVRLEDMVEEVARFNLTGSTVSLVYHHDEGLWPVDADRGQIQQVVSNLVINARQAMPNGGHLTITLENTELPEGAVPTLRQGRYVKITLRDEGCGIDPKIFAQIFDPYFTTKPSGSGLGLATAWSVITRHGGHIGLESELGKGTTFTVYLPASTSAQPTETRSPSAEFPEPERPANILVMDDEEAVSQLVARMLAPCGYSVVTASNAQEVIARYRQALEDGTPFDAVILDLTIPGGPGGKEAVKELLTLDSNVCAIVSSGYAEDPVMANPGAYGFKGTVAKPYTAHTLRDAIARVLA